MNVRSSSELERGRGLSAESREGKEGKGESVLRGEEHEERDKLKLWDLLKLERKETEQKPVSDSNNLALSNFLFSLPESFFLQFSFPFPSSPHHKERKEKVDALLQTGFGNPSNPTSFIPLLPLVERTFYPWMTVELVIK